MVRPGPRLAAEMFNLRLQHASAAARKARGCARAPRQSSRVANAHLRLAHANELTPCCSTNTTTATTHRGHRKRAGRCCFRQNGRNDCLARGSARCRRLQNSKGPVNASNNFLRARERKLRWASEGGRPRATRYASAFQTKMLAVGGTYGTLREAKCAGGGLLGLYFTDSVHISTVADNTVAKVAWAIGFAGRPQRYASIGDAIRFTIKVCRARRTVTMVKCMTPWSCGHWAQINPPQTTERIDPALDNQPPLLVIHNELNPQGTRISARSARNCASNDSSEILHLTRPGGHLINVRTRDKR